MAMLAQISAYFTNEYYPLLAHQDDSSELAFQHLDLRAPFGALFGLVKIVGRSQPARSLGCRGRRRRSAESLLALPASPEDFFQISERQTLKTDQRRDINIFFYFTGVDDILFLEIV